MSSLVETLLETSAADTNLLIQRDQQGDNFAFARPVDFMLHAPSAEQAGIIAEFINDNRYGAATASSNQHGHHVTVVITMPPTQNIVCSVSGLMACVAALFGGEYDGWGAVLQPRR